MPEGVPVSATDELRERLAMAMSALKGSEVIWDEDRSRADAILPLVAAVVAEARTEGAIAELEAAANSKHSVTTVVTASTVAPPEYAVSERFDFNQSERARLLARAVALRGVGNQKVGVTVDDLALDEMDGNQNAEPRWSANRLEEVLREGLLDQNAEPEWEWGYGHESESGLVPVLGFEGPYSEGRSRDIAEKQMNDDLRWRYPLALMKRRKAGPWLPADQKGTEQ